MREIADFIGSGSTDEDIVEVARNTAFGNMKATLAKISSDAFSNIVMNKGKHVVKITTVVIIVS